MMTTLGLVLERKMFLDKLRGIEKIIAQSNETSELKRIKTILMEGNEKFSLKHSQVTNHNSNQLQK